MLNLMMMRMMNEIDELIWQHNKERAIESLYDDKMVMVESLSTNRHRGDYRAK